MLKQLLQDKPALALVLKHRNQSALIFCTDSGEQVWILQSESEQKHSRFPWKVTITFSYLLT